MALPNRRAWLPWLQLCRLPALFSAWADIILGTLLATPLLPIVQGSPDKILYKVVLDANFFLLLGASSGLYLSGMVLNDYFDRELDQIERPERPIPSGAISAREASIFGLILMGIGIFLATLVHQESGLIGSILALTILAYNGLTKSTHAGPFVMGACRGLNVLLGASANGQIGNLISSPLVLAPLGLAVYITGVTFFARQESGARNKLPIWAGIGFVNAGGLLLISLLALNSSSLNANESLIGLILVGGFVNRRLLQALSDNQPKTIQLGVKTLLLSYVLLDAVLVFHLTSSALALLLVASLILPARWLGKWMTMT